MTLKGEEEEAALGRVLDSDALALYARLHRRQLHLKQAQAELLRVFRQVRGGSATPIAARDDAVRRLQRLRYEMQHVVQSVSGYLVVQFVHAHWKTLAAALDAAHNVDGVKAAHDAYLAKLARGCVAPPRAPLARLRSRRPSARAHPRLARRHHRRPRVYYSRSGFVDHRVGTCIERIFDSAVALGVLTSQWEGVTMDNPRFVSQLSQLRARWRQQCHAMLEELHAVTSNGVPSDAKLVDDLLLRLDFNGFFKLLNA